jgi:hypothetical protein
MEKSSEKTDLNLVESASKILIHDSFEQKLDDSSLLARIDERTRSMTDKITHIEKTLEDNYVTQKEFAPVRSVVFGMVGVILLSMLVAVIALIVRK